MPERALDGTRGWHPIDRNHFFGVYKMSYLSKIRLAKRPVGVSRSIAFATLFALSLHAWGAPTAKPLMFCTELSSPPAAYIAEDGTTPEGFEVDLMKAIAKQVGRPAQIQNFKFSTIFPALDSGKCDAVVSQLSKNPTRLEKYNFVDYAQAASGLLVTKGNPLHLAKYTDLSGKRVAVLLGGANAKRLEDANAALVAAGKQPMQIYTYQTEAFAYQELALHRVDAYVSGAMNLSYFLSKDSSDFEIGGMPVAPVTYGVVLRKNDSETANSVRGAVHALIASGEFQSMIDTWHLRQGVVPCDAAHAC
ncbi:MAG: ABC transporter substrate-binding protein [Janthinobacterium lividum]